MHGEVVEAVDDALLDVEGRCVQGAHHQQRVTPTWRRSRYPPRCPPPCTPPQTSSTLSRSLITILSYIGNGALLYW